MANHKQEKRPNKLSALEKADLRASLSRLLKEIDSNPDAARAALQTSLQLRLKVPVVLLTSKNIAGTLSLHEISQSLDRLSSSQIELDFSAGLSALQDLAKQQQPDRKAMLSIARAVTARLTRMVTPPVRKPKGAGLTTRMDESLNVFTESTLLSAIDLALWMLARLFDPHASSRRSTYSVGLRLVQLVEMIWRRSSPPSGARSVVSFLRSLPRVLPKAVYSELEDEPSLTAFFQDTNSALTQEAETALLEAQLKDLDSILTLAKKDGKGGDLLLSHLLSICRSRPSELLPEVVEWVARQTERNNPRVKSPTAFDESQSSALNYVAVCLLAAWDAAAEGNKAARALESTQRLARELFKTDLTGTPGQIIGYQEREHELSSQVSPTPTKVRLIRPGVRWSDGIRTRFLVRAIVEPAS
jgi:hypothetical protein